VFNLHLDEEEKVILLDLLETCISDLHAEISRTENLEFKTMLKGRKAVLIKLFESLQVSVIEPSVYRVT
jgi:hypothetical protein